MPDQEPLKDKLAKVLNECASQVQQFSIFDFVARQCLLTAKMVAGIYEQLASANNKVETLLAAFESFNQKHLRKKAQEAGFLVSYHKELIAEEAAGAVKGQKQSTLNYSQSAKGNNEFSIRTNKLWHSHRNITRSQSQLL